MKPLERNEECWQELKDETGYQFYREYLETYDESLFPSLKRIFAWEGYRFMSQAVGISTNESKSLENDKFSIFDIFEDGRMSTALTFSPPWILSQATEALKTLREPPSGTVIRILILDAKFEHVPYHAEIDKRDAIITLIGTIGLGLRTPPGFIHAFLQVHNFRDTEDQILAVETLDDAAHGTIGRAAFMLAQDYLPRKTNCPPVMIILGDPTSGYDFGFSQEPIRFSSPPHPMKPARRSWPELYKLRYRSTITRHPPQTLDIDQATLYALLPLLQVKIAILNRGSTAMNRFYYELVKYANFQGVKDSTSDGQIEDIRFQLRRQICEIERGAADLTRYLCARGKPELMSCREFRDFEQEASTCLEMARSLEAEVRDWLQLRVGDLALKESKKSIELSTLQIRESNRGKSPSSKLRPLTSANRRMICSENWYVKGSLGRLVWLTGGQSLS